MLELPNNLPPIQGGLTIPQPTLVRPIAGVPDLSSAFQAQHDQAAQAAQAVQDSAFNVYNDRTSQLNGEAALMQHRPEMGQLEFGTNAHNVGEGVLQGIGNAVNNAMVMRQYNQKNQDFHHLAGLYNQAMQDQQTQLEHRANQHLNTYNRLLESNPDLAFHYANADEAGRTKIQEGLSGGQVTHTMAPTVTADEKQKTLAVGQANNQVSAEKTAAEKQAQDNEFLQLTGVTRGDLFKLANKGQLTPQLRNAFQSVYKQLPEDFLDYKGRFADTAGKVEQAKGAKIDNQTRGARNEASLKSTLVGTYGQQLENALKSVTVRFAEQNAQNDANNKALTNQEKAQQIADRTKAQSILDNLAEGQHTGTLTDEDLFKAESQLKLMKIDVSPISSLHTLLNKPNKGKSLSTQVGEANQDNPLRQKNEKWATDNGYKPLPSGAGYLDAKGVPQKYPAG